LHAHAALLDDPWFPTTRSEEPAMVAFFILGRFSEGFLGL
jgi:hypothetical protein